MLDARFLIDVHFRQGGKKDKDSLIPQAEASSHIPPHTPPPPEPPAPPTIHPQPYQHQTEEWHLEEDRLGGSDEWHRPEQPKS